MSQKRKLAKTGNSRRKTRLVFHDADDAAGSDPPPSQVPVTEWNILSDRDHVSRTNYSLEMPSSPPPEDSPNDATNPHVEPPVSNEPEHPNFDHADFFPSLFGDDGVFEVRAAPTPHVNPLDEWKKEVQIFVDELCRLDGRGDYISQDKCCVCATPEPRYRCKDGCFSDQLYCQSCLLCAHKGLPFHSVECWTDASFFRPVTLRALGLRIQLGHPTDERCIKPQQAKADKFTVIDKDHIHEVSLDFCGCDRAKSHTIQLLRSRLFPATVLFPATAITFGALDHFQMLSFESKISVYEFYHAIARQTDNTGMKSIKERLDELRRVIREWRHLHMLKRAGRGHDPAGVAATTQGSCAVLCPACPQPGMNLPEGWETADEETRWLYALFLGMDANFRAKRKNISSEEKDPSLSKGYSYFVDQPSYQEYLTKYKDDKQEKSTCVSHDAVNSADTKDTRGLIVTGIGAVDCIRHDMRRPNSVGDLQKGEKFLNMDFFLYCTLATTLVLYATLSYDIMCQYGVHFWDRMKRKFPNDWRVNSGAVSFKWLIPKFHLPAHIEKCHREYSFNFTKDVARTDGEAPERGWARINGLSGSTKEMGPGARRDTMEDHMGDSNWKKIIDMGRSLLTKFKNAITESIAHRTALQELESVLNSEEVETWRGEVEAWEKDGHTNRNPFEPRVNPPTQADIRLALATEESLNLETSSAETVRSEVSPSAMITMGLELEELQRKLQADIASLGPHATSLQKTKLIERSNTLRRRINSWIDVQVFYIPGTSLLRAQAEDSTEHLSELHSFKIKLWLPSEIGGRITCDTKLRNYEWQLREAQANDSLKDLRSSLRLHDFLIKKKKNWSRGVAQNTRSATAINQAMSRVEAHATKYRAAWEALTRLAPLLPSIPEMWTSVYRELKPEDVRGLPREALEVGEGSIMLSWIWMSYGAASSPQNQAGLTDALRIQWLRTRARAMRWDEEVRLLQEEMRRVNVFLTWQGEWWIGQSTRREFRDTATEEGIACYARRQALLRFSLRDHFSYLWRYNASWLESGSVPDGRNWYSDVIQPEFSTPNVFNGR